MSHRGPIDLTKFEDEAIERVGPHAGKYLDSIGKTDLASMTLDEWNAFIKHVCKSYIAEIRDVIDTDVPYTQ